MHLDSHKKVEHEACSELQIEEYGNSDYGCSMSAQVHYYPQFGNESESESEIESDPDVDEEPDAEAEHVRVLWKNYFISAAGYVKWQWKKLT